MNNAAITYLYLHPIFYSKEKWNPRDCFFICNAVPLCVVPLTTCGDSTVTAESVKGLNSPHLWALRMGLSEGFPAISSLSRAHYGAGIQPPTCLLPQDPEIS